MIRLCFAQFSPWYVINKLSILSTFNEYTHIHTYMLKETTDAIGNLNATPSIEISNLYAKSTMMKI